MSELSQAFKPLLSQGLMNRTIEQKYLKTDGTVTKKNMIRIIN